MSPNAAAVRLNADALDQFVADPLMVAFAMIMGQVFGECAAEVPLAQRYQAVQTFLSDGPDKAFRVRMAVRRTCVSSLMRAIARSAGVAF
jgi:hypothetical protein